MQFRLTTNGLGGAATAVQVPTVAMNNIFDNVSPAEAENGSIDYRAIDVFNDSASDVTGVKIYMSVETSSADSEMDMGAEASALNATTGIVDETTAPPGVTFAHHLESSSLALPDIPAGEYARVWLRRTINAGAANTSSDQGTIEVVYA